MFHGSGPVILCPYPTALLTMCSSEHLNFDSLLVNELTALPTLMTISVLSHLIVISPRAVIMFYIIFHIHNISKDLAHNRLE